jgi:hypothetical protein
MPVLESLIADVTSKFVAAKNIDAAFVLKAATELGKKLAGLEMEVSEKKAVVALALKKAVAAVPVPDALEGVVASVMGATVDAAVGVVRLSSLTHSLLKYLPSCFQVAAAPVLDSMDKALIAEAVASQSPQTVVSSQESLAVRVPDAPAPVLPDIPETNIHEKEPNPEASPPASLVPSRLD